MSRPPRTEPDTPVTVDEQIAWCLARRCRPGDVLVVGVATPLAAAAGYLARALLVDDLVILQATAVDPASQNVAVPIVAPAALVEGSVGVLTQPEVLDAIARGEITLQFISPAQVDSRGALNASRVRDRDGRLRRLPGGLAIADVAATVGRLVVYRAEHSSRFLPERVEFTTGAPGRVEAVVSSRAVLEPAAGRLRLASLHAGEALADVVAGCGFELTVEEPLRRTDPPPPEALRLLREEIDPHGLRRLEVRQGRAAALDALAALASGR